MIFKATFKGTKISFHKEDIFSENKKIIVKSARACNPIGENRVITGLHDDIEICFCQGNIYRDVVRYAKNCDDKNNRPVPPEIPISEIQFEEKDRQLIDELLKEPVQIPERLTLDKIDLTPSDQETIRQLFKKKEEKKHRRRLAKA